MVNNDQHVMQLERSYESGAEEWYCPVCERRFIVQWSPNYKKIILNPGDEYAVHSGGKGGIVMQPPQVNHHSNGKNGTNGQTEPMLSVQWQTAIEALDFSDWPDRKF